MDKTLNCHCGGLPVCRLCHGTGHYEYRPGPMGWMPFDCPTCEGRKVSPDDGSEPCPTCRGEGRVDPAAAPVKGSWNKLWKILMGA